MEKIRMLEDQATRTKVQMKAFWQSRESPGAEIMLESSRNISQEHRPPFQMLLSMRGEKRPAQGGHPEGSGAEDKIGTLSASRENKTGHTKDQEWPLFPTTTGHHAGPATTAPALDWVSGWSSD